MPARPKADLVRYTGGPSIALFRLRKPVDSEYGRFCFILVQRSYGYTRAWHSDINGNARGERIFYWCSAIKPHSAMRKMGYHVPTPEGGFA